MDADYEDRIEALKSIMELIQLANDFVSGSLI